MDRDTVEAYAHERWLTDRLTDSERAHRWSLAAGIYHRRADADAFDRAVAAELYQRLGYHADAVELDTTTDPAVKAHRAHASRKAVATVLADFDKAMDRKYGVGPGQPYVEPAAPRMPQSFLKLPARVVPNANAGFVRLSAYTDAARRAALWGVR